MALTTTFNPAYGTGVEVAPAASSAATEIGFGSQSIVVTNLGSSVAYVRCGLSTVAASTADYPVLGGQQVSLTKFQDHTHVAYISAAGTSLHIIAGEGM